MMRAVIIAALALAVASAATDFSLQYPTKFIVTDATTPKACFESTKTSIPFTYGTSLKVSDDGTTETPATPAKSCGNAAGQVSDLFADRVWAVKRNGNVETGDCLDLWNGAAQKPAAWTGMQQDYLGVIANYLKANQADDVFNVMYRLIITRQLWACKYDSNVDNGGTGNDPTDADADTKVALRREDWQVYHINFGSIVLDDLISSISAGAKTTDAWKVPTTGVEATAFYAPFAGGQANCQTSSTKTCKPGSAVNCNNADKIESYACASSAQLLARAGQTSYSPANSFKTFPGLSKDFFGDAVDGKTGLLADLWASVSAKIATFKGTRISTSKPADMVSGRYLDFVQGAQFKVMLSNFQESTGFYTSANSFNAQVGIVAAKPAVYGAGNALAFKTTAFDPATSTITFDDNGVLVFTNALPQSHYWANLQTTFTLQANWTCKSIGTTLATPTAVQVTDSTEAGTYGRFRYNCDKTYAQATGTPGVAYNDADADYPASSRLYRGFTMEQTFMPLNNPINVVQLKADPVYIGFLRSLANTGAYSVAGNLDGINGKISPRYERLEKLFEGFVQFSDKQSDGWFTTGVATVLISVLFPLSWCIGNAILGKSGGGSTSGGKSLDVNFSGTKNQA